MKLISDLYKNVRNVDWYKRQFKFEAGKKNILFIDPVMMNFDFYSGIIPYLALSEDQEKFNTAITGLYRFSEIETKPQTLITGAQARWADVMVQPLNMEDLKPLADELREVNSECKIITTVEFDFYELTNDHYLLEDDAIMPILEHQKLKPTAKNKTKVRKELKKRIVNRLHSNLEQSDRIVVLNQHLLEKLESKGFRDIQYCPIVIDPDTFLENIDYQDTLGIRLTEGQMVLSCELTYDNKNAFKEFIPQFRELEKKHGANFKLVILGEEPQKYFSDFDMECTIIPRGSIVSQFKMIWKSSADIHLMLNKKNIYTTNSMNLFSWVDRGMLGIPIVSLNVSPLKELIENGKTGFLINRRSDLVKLVDEHIASKATLVEMSKSLKEFIRQSCQLDDKKLEYLGHIFGNFEDPEYAKEMEEEIEKA